MKYAARRTEYLVIARRSNARNLKGFVMESYQLVSFFTGEITGFVSVLSIGVHGDNL